MRQYLVDGRVLREDLVGDAPHERFVGERLRLQVGREDDQHVERNLELAAGMQRQEVDAALERHDPAVQEVARRDALAAEVVDDEDAAVGLHLDRRFVEPRDRVEREVEHLQRQLAADHDDRPLDLFPAPVVRRRGDHAGRRRGAADVHVVDRIERGDRLAVDVDGVRHEHVGAERPADPFGHDGLAVSGSAVEEERLARIHRRPELIEHRAVDDEILEPFREAVAIDIRPRRHAGADVGAVLRQRNRRRPDVLGDLQELHGPVPAQVGQDVAVSRAAGAARAAHFDELLGAGVLDHRVEHRVRQAERLGQARARGLAPDQRLQHQLRQRVAVQAGVGDGGGRRRRSRLFRGRGLRRVEGQCAGAHSAPPVASSMRCPICVPVASS